MIGCYSILEDVEIENGNKISTIGNEIDFFRCPCCKEINIRDINRLNIIKLEKELKNIRKEVWKKKKKSEILQIVETLIESNNGYLNSINKGNHFSSNVELNSTEVLFNAFLGNRYGWGYCELLKYRMKKDSIKEPIKTIVDIFLKYLESNKTIEIKKTLRYQVLEVFKIIDKSINQDISIIKKIRKSGKVRFTNIKNDFFIQENENICKNCGQEFFEFKYVRESSMTSFSHFSMREKEDKLIANFTYDRSALWVDRKSSKFEIKGFNDKILFSIVFNINTGQSYIINPVTISNGKKRKLGRSIVNITSFDERFIFPGEKIIYENVPKEILSQIYQKLHEMHVKNNDKCLKLNEDKIRNLSDLIKYNRLPQIFFPKKISDLYYYRESIRGYKPGQSPFEILSRFKDKKSIRKMMAEDFSVVITVNLFKKVKDVNNMVKVIKWFNHRDNQKYLVSSDRKDLTREINKFVTRLIKEFGETVAVNKIIAADFKILIDSASMYTEIISKEKIKKEKIIKDNSFKRKSIKEIHDELSVIVSTLEKENLPISYKEESVLEGIFKSVQFYFPKETHEIIKAGALMGICVGGKNYIDRAINGNIRIILGYQKMREETVPVVCIEQDVESKEIIQVKGKYNQSLTGEILDSFNLWMTNYNDLTGAMTNTRDIQTKAKWNKLKRLSPQVEAEQYFEYEDIAL